MKSILVTGGTTFVSKYVANYFKEKAYKVYARNQDYENCIFTRNQDYCIQK